MRWLHYSVLGLIYLSGAGTLAFHLFFHTPILGQSLAAVDCPQVGPTHNLEIRDQQFMPTQVAAQVCDQLLIINTGTSAKLPAWGNPGSHLKFPGYEERILQPGEQISIDLRTSGSLLLHDHFSDSFSATIDIRP